MNILNIFIFFWGGEDTSIPQSIYSFVGTINDKGPGLQGNLSIDV